MSAPVCSRRVSAGITPAPGSTSRLPVWWGRVDWTRIEVPVAVWAHRDLCREHHVSPDTVVAVAKAMAGYADAATGRSCRPTNERLLGSARCSQSTVQRARRVLKALGLVVVVTYGQTSMTRAERLAAWERGSSHRAIAAEFALCSRRGRRPRLVVDNSRSHLQVVDRDHPPVGQVVSTQAREISGLSSDEKPKRGSRSAALTAEKRLAKAPRPVDLRARRLAEAVRSRLRWLSDTPTSRIVPLLTPYARNDWTARDVDLAVCDVLAVNRWTVPTHFRQSAAAYLAMLLRGVDPADRPTVLDDAHAAAERAHHRLQSHGAPCAHGVPGGDVVSPLTGQRGCPLCRTRPSSPEGAS